MQSDYIHLYKFYVPCASAQASYLSILSFSCCLFSKPTGSVKIHGLDRLNRSFCENHFIYEEDASRGLHGELQRLGWPLQQVHPTHQPSDQRHLRIRGRVAACKRQVNPTGLSICSKFLTDGDRCFMFPATPINYAKFKQ